MLEPQGPDSTPANSYSAWRNQWPARLSTRTLNILHHAGVNSPGQLLLTHPGVLAMQRNCGPTTFRELLVVVRSEAARQIDHWEAWSRDRRD